jgi:hypothetical protein
METHSSSSIINIDYTQVYMNILEELLHTFVSMTNDSTLYQFNSIFKMSSYAYINIGYYELSLTFICQQECDNILV